MNYKRKKKRNKTCLVIEIASFLRSTWYISHILYGIFTNPTKNFIGLISTYPLQITEKEKKESKMVVVLLEIIQYTDSHMSQPIKRNNFYPLLILRNYIVIGTHNSLFVLVRKTMYTLQHNKWIIFCIFTKYCH